ncbi:MAG: hypothetical protein JNK87_19845, partial [Bryobacterales bacterium]|nr:hypothetical protein [Bryobacterales bacterium]
MKRFLASAAFAAAATLCLTLAAPNAAQGAATVGGQNATRNRPGLIDPTCGLVGGPALASTDCNSQTGREWEG